MIDERFSAQAFEEAGYSTKQSRQLANLLQEEIAAEMHKVILKHFQDIIQRLSYLEHNLKLYEPPEVGDVHYRDDCEDENGYHCKLRIGFDLIISTGYAHLCGEEKISETEIIDSDDPEVYPEIVDVDDPNIYPDKVIQSEL